MVVGYEKEEEDRRGKKRWNAVLSWWIMKLICFAFDWQTKKAQFDHRMVGFWSDSTSWW